MKIIEFFVYLVALIAPKRKKSRPTRLHVKDVLPGEYIWIEYFRIDGKFGYLECLSNDPKTKKILLKVRWSNYKEIGCNYAEQLIFKYNSNELKNFHLLNSTRKYTSEIDRQDDFDIPTLQEKMNKAIEREEYEKADELQKKINKLTQK